MRLRKLAADYDVHDRTAALGYLQHQPRRARSSPGCSTSRSEPEDLHAHLRTVDAPLNALGEKELCPGQAALDKFNAACARRKDSRNVIRAGLVPALALARHNAMEKRRLGRSDLHRAADARLQRVRLERGRADLVRILDAFVDAGFNAIDTSDSYSRWVPGHPGGESETIIGNWLKKGGKRDKVLIATKVGEDMGEGRSLRKDYILRECEASLRRLQTDYIDLYQTHFDDEVTPPEETMQAYAALIAAGKVRASGPPT